MKDSDIRWKQRFANYQKAFTQLEEAVELYSSSSLSKLEEQGIIKAFEFTYELAWNLLKDYLVFQGITNITGSRDSIREAFNLGLINDGEFWMEMIISRNKTSHTYYQTIAEEILQKIAGSYYHLFEELNIKFTELCQND